MRCANPRFFLTFEGSQRPPSKEFARQATQIIIAGLRRTGG
jgi:hypothetical protein